MQLIDTVLRNLEQALSDWLFGRRAVWQIDVQRRDFEVADFINLKWTIGHCGIRAEVDPSVDVSRAAEVTHPDHVGLAREDVDLDWFRCIARLAVWIGQLGRDICGGNGKGSWPE